MKKIRKRKYVVRLDEQDVKRLNQIIQSKKVSKTVIRRAQLLLSLNVNNPRSLSNQQAANSLGMHEVTVSNLAKQFVQEGLESVLTLKRNENSNAPRKIDGHGEAIIIQIACSQPPAGHQRWSLRLIAEETKVRLETPVSKDAVRAV